MSDVDYADMQGLVRFGYGHMTRASYALVKVKNVAAAKSWLRSASVTSAVATKPPPVTALNVAFTAPGLSALGLPQSVIAGFSHEFRGGMTPTQNWSTACKPRAGTRFARALQFALCSSVTIRAA